MIIKIAMNKEDIKILDICRMEANIKMSDMLEDSEEELTEEEYDVIDELLAMSDVLERIVAVAENKRMMIKSKNKSRRKKLKETAVYNIGINVDGIHIPVKS